MKKNKRHTLNLTISIAVLILAATWNVSIFGLFTYLIFFKGASAWWYVLVFLCQLNVFKGLESLGKYIAKSSSLEEV